MKLSLKMISEKLEEQIRVLRIRDIYSTVRLDRPVFLTEETTLSENTLYLTDAGHMPENLRWQEGSALIVCGSVSLDEKNMPSILIVSDETVSVLSLHNMINRVFDYYDQWEEQLRGIVYYNKHTPTGFEQLLRISADMTRNTMILSDPAFYQMSCSPSDACPDDDKTVAAPQPAQFMRLSAEMIENIKSAHFYQMLQTEKESYLISDPVFSHRLMVRNIFSGASVQYHLCITEDLHPFRDTDHLLLEILAGYLTEYLLMANSDSKSAEHPLAGLLMNAASSGNWNRPAVETELLQMKWAVSDPYAVVCTSSLQNTFFQFLPIKETELFLKIPGVITCIRRNQLIVLFNLNHMDPPCIETTLDARFQYVRKRVADALQDQLLQVGISNLFLDIYDFGKALRQAEIACAFCAKNGSVSSFLFFRECAMDYMFHTVSREFDPRDLLSPIYLRLKEHDQQNNTEYLKTLQEYLSQNLNAVQTASALFMHRATIIYRIKRICEIGQTELKKPDELLHLALSFKLDSD